MEAITKNEEPRLLEIVKCLVETYQSLRIYLFGSQARGGAGSDSDGDLLFLSLPAN